MRPSFGTPAGPPAGTRTKFVTRNETVESVPRSAPSRGEAIERAGAPVAGPRVTITAIDAVTSGLRADPLFITSCKRIACGPEGSGITTVFVLEVSANPPSTKTAAWPESGVDGPASGSVRLKFVTAKTIATGDPSPTIALFAGDTMESVGPGAARAFGAMRPEPPSNPIVTQTRMRALRFTPTPLPLRFLDAELLIPARGLSPSEDQDDQDEGEEQRDSAVRNERQADGGGRGHMDRDARGGAWGHLAAVVVHEARSDRDVAVRQGDEEDRIVLDDLHHHDPFDEQLQVPFVRRVRLSVRFHEGEVRDPVGDVDAVARRLERRGREDLDFRNPGGGTLRGDHADGCAHVGTQRRAVVREELHPGRVRSRGERERERLGIGDKTDDLAVQVRPRMSLVGIADLPGPPRLDHREVGDGEANHHGIPARDDRPVSRRQDGKGRSGRLRSGGGERRGEQGHQGQGEDAGTPVRIGATSRRMLQSPHAFLPRIRATRRSSTERPQSR